MYLANSVGSDFNAPNERSLQLRYTWKGPLFDAAEFKLSLWGVRGWGADARDGAAVWAAQGSLLHNLYWKNGRPVSGPEQELGLATSYRLTGGSLKDMRLQLSLISHVNSRYYLGDSYREAVFTMNMPIDLR